MSWAQLTFCLYRRSLHQAASLDNLTTTQTQWDAQLSSCYVNYMGLPHNTVRFRFCNQCHPSVAGSSKLETVNTADSWKLKSCTMLIENTISFPSSFQQADVSNNPSVEESEMNRIQRGLWKYKGFVLCFIYGAPEVLKNDKSDFFFLMCKSYYLVGTGSYSCVHNFHVNSDSPVNLSLTIPCILLP